MVRMRKERFPQGTYNKLLPRKIGHFSFLKCINDNVYAIQLPADANFSSTFIISDLHAYKPLDDENAQLLELKTCSLKVEGIWCSGPRRYRGSVQLNTYAFIKYFFSFRYIFSYTGNYIIDVGSFRYT